MAEQYTVTVRPSAMQYGSGYTSNVWDLSNGSPNLTTYNKYTNGDVTLKNNNCTFNTLKLDFVNANIPSNARLLTITYKIILKRTSTSKYSYFSCGIGYAENNETTKSAQQLILSSIKDSTLSSSDPQYISNGPYANGDSQAKKPATIENQITATWEDISQQDSNLIMQSGCPVLFMSTNGDYYIFNIEIDVTYEELPQAISNIYIGNLLASEIYVGNKKATAVYIGTTQVL